MILTITLNAAMNNATGFYKIEGMERIKKQIVIEKM